MTAKRKYHNPDRSLCLFIIDKYTKKENRIGSFWPREMKLAQYLVANFSNKKEDWEEFELGFQLNSLAFLKGKGAEFFKNAIYDARQQKKFVDEITIKEDNKVTLQETKVGEDKVISNKPKTLADFLGK